MKDFWRPFWVRGGRIEDIVLIGKDVLAWCVSVCIVFFNANHRRMHIRWCSSSVTGEGACCLSSHSFYSIFAFAEKCTNPRIMIYAYPSFARIAECAKGSVHGYLTTAFTSKDQIASISVDDNFTMIIWCWRTGEKLVSVNTSIKDTVGQILKTTSIGQIVIAQMGRTCGKLVTWDFEIVGKNILYKDHEIILPKQAPAYWVDWSPHSIEPLLAICDKDGHIYLSNLDGTNVRRIVISLRCNVCVDIELPVICWFRNGIVLRTTFCQIRYYTLDSATNTWRKEWHVKSLWRPYILVVHPFRSDRLFYYTLEGNLMQIDFSENAAMPNINRHFHNGYDYKTIDFVYPWCHHLIGIDYAKDLVVLESYSGTEVGRLAMEIRGSVSNQASHPSWPMFAIVSTEGELLIVGVTKPDAPNVIARIYLHDAPLDFIRFSQSGRFLIVAERRSGASFVIRTQIDNLFSIVCHIKPMKRITDALIYDYYGNVKALLLEEGLIQFSVGHHLIVYDVSEHPKETAVLDLTNVFKTLHQVPGNPTLLLGSPYITRQLLLLKVNDFKDVSVVNGMLSGHHVRRPHIYTDRNWITTCSLDGLVVVRDRTVSHIVAVVMPLHRRDLGTKKAITNTNGDVIIALGYKGSLIAMKVQDADKREPRGAASGGEDVPFLYRMDFLMYEHRKSRILHDYTSLDPGVASLLSGPRRGFGTEDDEIDKTWTTWKAERKIEAERLECAEERAAILREFEVLKAALVKLLDRNEADSEIERLPISEFDLDKTARDHWIKVARDEREDVRLQLESSCNSMDRVAAWIKSTFWNLQTVLGQSVFSYQGSTEVTNYPLTAEDPYADVIVKWAQFMRESVRRIIESETFIPWKVYRQSELEFELHKPIKLYREDERQRMTALFDEEDETVDREDLEEHRALEGMTTHRFVEQSPYYYSQMETYGCGQIILNNLVLADDSGKLRRYFNELFDDVAAQKDRETFLLKERIERIRHIDSELRTMFDQSVPSIPVDPEFHAKEKPESIVKVLDEEVKARPYISPSQQDIIDKQRAEAERLRQLLLADDFRERALMAMMDGVLEVRWEDVIKIDIPKPRCMIDKQPEQFTAEDTAAVSKYEKDVEFLKQERERYKRILEADYARIALQFQEAVEKFDAKLDEFFQVRMKIEAALNQLSLRYARGYIRINQRARSLMEDDRIKERIAKKESYLSELRERMEVLGSVRQDFVNHYEALCAREKLLMKKFRTEFLNLSRVNAEILEKYYKRRPRINLKGVAIMDLQELCKNVVNHTKPTNQTPECIEFLRQLDIIDSKPGALATIDSTHWEHLVKIRRHKIDLELRIRVQNAEIDKIDEAIERFNSKITKYISDIGELREELMKLRENRIVIDQNAELQLVMKMGQVELNLQGYRKDTSNAILIPREEIDTVNKLILAAAGCKMDALNRTVDFRRGTLYKEWIHGCMKMQLDNLQEDLEWLEKMPLTRDIQEFLKRKARGWKDNRTVQHLEKEMESMQQSFAKVLREKVDRLEDLRGRIAAVKKNNDLLDKAIVTMNVVRCEMELSRDREAEDRNRLFVDRKTRIIMERSDLIKKLQDNYVELLALQTEHELLRMKRYPELQYLKPLCQGDTLKC